jgi:nitrate reductase (cytochrome), electron transfer subunit
MGRLPFPPLLVLSLIAPLHLAACDTASPQPRPESIPLQANRLFDGAPPTIPHDVAELGRQDCLSCHLEGDAVSDGQQATATPHPELERCQQCHVPQTLAGDFVASDFAGGVYPMGQRAHAEAPWLIPHPLTMRENCLGCHGPEADEAALRTDHPERIRCQQCHVPAQEGWPGPRKDLEIDPWQTVP